MAKKLQKSEILETLLQDYFIELQARYEKAAKDKIAYWLERLEEAGWDLNVVAPYPKAGFSDYRVQMERRNFIESITVATKSSYKTNEPQIRISDSTRQEKIIESYRKEAISSFETYIHKLIGKIGAEVKEADLNGNLWSGSVLKVTTISGEVQKWKTQMIINQSKFHVLFNQFPTRRMK